VGKVVAHTRLDDGRYKLLLMGGKRALIESELSAPQPFRTAQVTLLDDLACDDNDRQRQAVLSEKFMRHLRSSLSGNPQLNELLRQKVSLGLLTDIVASVLELAPQRKYELLEQTSAIRRAEMLLVELAALEKAAAPQSKRGFPPSFSAN
jgi:Lon protease-like protein